MTMTPETLEALVVKISGDLSDLRADLQNAVNMAQQAGQQAGNAFGQGARQGGGNVDAYFKTIQDAVRGAVGEAKAGIVTNEQLTATLRVQEAELRELVNTTQRGTAAYRQYVDELGRVTGELNRLDRAQDSVSANSTQAGTGVAGLVGQFGSLRASIQGAVAAATAWAGNQAIKGLYALADEANKADTAVKVFELTLRRFNVTTESANDVAKRLAERFGLSMASVQESMTTLIRAGFRDMGQLEKVMTGAAASAVAFGRDARTGFESLGDAAVTGLSAALNAIGISENLGPILDKYAKSLGKTADALSDVERAQALSNLVLKATATEVDALDTILNDYVKGQADAKNATENVRKEIGRALMPALTSLSGEYARAMNAALAWAKENKGELKESINAVAIAVTDAWGAIKVLIGFIADLGTAIGGVLSVTNGLALAVGGGVVGLFSGFVTEIKTLFNLALESLQTFQTAWEKMKSGDLKGALGLVAGQAQENWDAVRNAPANIWGNAKNNSAFGAALTGEGWNDIASFGSRTTDAAASANASSNRVRNALDGMVKGQELIDALALVGRRRGAAYGNKYLNGQIHNGEDFFAPTGTALTAPFTGLVTKRWSETTGHIIEMIDAQGNKLLLGHLDKYATGLEAAIEKAGGKLMVKAGTVLGTVGETGSLANIMGAKNNDHVHIMARAAGQAAGANTSPLNVAFKGFNAENAWNGVTGSAGGNSGPAKEATKSWQEYEKEARRIIGQISKYASDGAAPDGKKWAAATEALKTFSKQNDLAAAAVAWVQSETKKAAAETSKYGQQFDKLKGKLDVTDSLSKLGQNVVPQLKLIQSEAEKAAATEIKRNGQTEKYRQLLGLAADAAAKLNTIQDRKPELSDLEKERQAEEKRLALIKQEGEIRNASAKRLNEIISAGVQKEGDGQRIQLAAKELERRGQLTERAARQAREAREREAREAMEDRERMLAQRQKDGERDIQATIELAQKQGEAERTILLKYAEERRALLGKAQSGTLTAEDVDAYKARLASFVKEAGKAGVDTSEVLKNAHASAMKFLDTALDSNALAIANTASQYDGLSDAVSRGAARNATYQASLEDVLALLPGNADEWDAFIALMEQLDVKGNLAAGVMEGLRQKVQDLKDEMALDEGDRAAAIELANIAADPLAYADGAGRAGNTQAQAEARQRLADDLQQTLLGLDDATLQNADAMQVYEDMLTNAAQQGAITDKQLRELLDTLNLLKGSTEDFSQYADVTDGARGVKPSIGGLSPEQHIQNFEDFNATLLELTDTELQSAVGMKALEDGLKGAAASGAITEQQLSDLLDTLNLLKQAASTGGEDFSQYEGITDGARGVQATPGADFEKQTAYAVELTAQLRQEFKGLAGDTEALAEKTAFWNDILSNAVTTGAITEGQMKALQAVMSGTVKAEELLAAAQKKVNEANGEFVGPNAAMIASLELLRGKANTNQEELERLIKKLKELDTAAADQRGIDQLISKLDQLAGNFQKAGQIAKMFTDGGENAVSILGDWVTMNTTAYKQFQSGDIGGAILTTIEGILNVGESIASLNPQLREYKKNMLEIAQLEKEAMGSKTYGNIKNPYYDDLAKDASNREKLGNSKWYQRLWWGLTGSTPQVMEDGAAKLKAKAAEIFGGLADSINTLWNNAWEKAFTDGTSLDLTANLTKMLNLEVAKEAMAQVLEKANIGEYLKAYTDARAAGQDGAAQLEALRQALIKAGQDADAILKTLPGYGEGADPAAREREQRLKNLDNGQAGLKLQRDRKLISDEEYERQSLALTLQRLKVEMEQELAAEGLTEEQKAAIREKYLLASEQAEFDSAERIRNARLEMERKIGDARLNNEGTANELAYRAGLKSKEDYEKEKLRLTLARLKAEEAAEVAAAGGNADLIAAIHEKYRLAGEMANLDFKDALTGPATIATDAGTEAAQNFASAFSGTFESLMNGGNIGDRIRNSIRSLTIDAVDAKMQERISDLLKPQLDGLMSSIGSGMQIQDRLGQLVAGIPAIEAMLTPIYQPLADGINRLIPSVNNLNDTIKGKQFQNTTAVTYVGTGGTPGDFAAQLAFL